MDKPGQTLTDVAEEDEDCVKRKSHILQKALGLEDGCSVTISINDGNIRVEPNPQMSVANVALLIEAGHKALMNWAMGKMQDHIKH